MKSMIFTGCFLALVLNACRGSGTATGPYKLGMEDNGKNLTLHPAQRIEINLAGNPTTGYVWEQQEGDATILKQIGEATYTQDSPGKAIPGQGGTFTFVYEAVAVGETTLKLVYHRPFEESIPPAETFILGISVK